MNVTLTKDFSEYLGSKSKNIYTLIGVFRGIWHLKHIKIQNTRQT